MKDIVVLAGSTPWSVLSLCKCAFLRGAKTFTVCLDNGWGRKYSHSKYVHRAYDTKEVELDVFWEAFFKENIFVEKPILHVTNDYVCQIITAKRDYYEEHFTLCMASSYIIDSFIDKNKASVEATRHGLTVPKTKEIHTTNDLKLDDFSFPVIVKPVTFRDHSNAGFKTQICQSIEGFRTFVHSHLENSIRLQVQEYIQGEDKDCVFYQFYRNIKGQIVECMGEKTLQTNGIMTIGTTLFDEDLAKTCRAFLNEIDYVGIGGIEFKKHNGHYYFIEMSTRTEGFLSISDMASVSLAEASFLDLNGLQMKQMKQKENEQYIVFVSWLLHLYNKHGLLYVVGQYLKHLLFSKSHFVGSYLDWKFAFMLNFRLLR